MKVKRIIFTFVDEDTASRMTGEISNIVGKDNITIIPDTLMPEILIRCKRKVWKELLFKYDFESNYNLV